MQKIFISSTFRDMQAERDAIHTVIVPELRKISQQYGENVEVCDLRWGVNTGDLDSESGAQKVLSVCLDEIDKCKPFMLVMLGERYGWIPEPELLKNAASTKDYLLEDLDKSVTALEIEYGALGDPDVLKRSIFLFREPMPEADDDYQSEGEEYTKRLNALKDRIYKIAGDRVFSYQLRWDNEKKRPTELNRFTDIVIEQLHILLEQEWKQDTKLHENQKEEKRHWAFVEKKANQFGGRNSLLKDCKEKLENGKGTLAIVGEIGSGKSTLCCKMAVDYRMQGWNVFPFICGNTGRSTSAMDILKQWIFYIEDLLEIEHFEEDESANKKEEDWKGRLCDVLAMYNGRDDLADILLEADGLDQLRQDELVKSFGFVPTFGHQKVHFLLSCLKDFDREHYRGDVILVNLMTKQEKAEVLHGILSYQGKGLDANVVREILEKPNADNPLYLSLLMQRLAMMDKNDFDVIAKYGNDMAAINRYQIELIQQAPEVSEELICLLIQETAERINKKLMQKAVEYIAASRHGLRESDLQMLLEKEGIPWNSLDFSRAVYYMSMLFVERTSGEIDFTHRIVRGSLTRKFDVKQRMCNIFDYIKKLPMEDEFRLSEIVYYCYMLDDKEFFMKYVQKGRQVESENAVREMYYICMGDEGEWINSILERHMYVRDMFVFINRLNKEFVYGTIRELQIQLKMNLRALEIYKEEDVLYNSSESAVRYGKICYIISNIYRDLGDFKSALYYCERYFNIVDQTIKNTYSMDKTGDLFAEYSNSCYALAYLYERMGRYNDAAERYNVCLAEKLFEDRGTYCLLLVSLGRVYEQMEQLLDAIVRLETAVEISEKLYTELKRDSYLELYKNCCEYLGKAYVKAGQYEEAMSKFQISYKINRNLYETRKIPMNQRNYGISCLRIGEVYERQGDLEKALEYYMEDLKICEDLCMEQNTWNSKLDYCVPCDRVGMIYEKKDNIDAALEKYLISYKLRKEIFELNSDIIYMDNYAISCGNLGRMYTEKEEYAQALEFFLMEERIRKELHDKGQLLYKYSDYVFCWENIAAVYYKMGQHIFAIDAYQTMTKAAEELYRRDPSEVNKVFYEEKIKLFQKICKLYNII